MNDPMGSEGRHLLHGLTEGGYVFPTWESALLTAAQGVGRAYDRRRRTFEAAHKAGLSYATIGSAAGLSGAAVHKIVRRGERSPSQDELLNGPAAWPSRS